VHRPRITTNIDDNPGRPIYATMAEVEATTVKAPAATAAPKPYGIRVNGRLYPASDSQPAF
jgi:hypothetical protein